MANTSSAKKALKQNEKNKAINTARKTMVKTYIKRVQTAIAEKKSPAEITVLLSEANAVLARAGNKNVIHKNTVARKIGRLAKKVNSYMVTTSK